MEETRHDVQASELYAKLARVMGRLDRIPKRGHNTYFDYDYVLDGDVTDAVREALAAEKVALLANLVGSERQEDRTVVTIEFTFVCGDTGASHTCRWQGEAVDKQDKGLSKAYTMAKKYFLLTTLLISSGTEPDADEENETRDKTPRRATTTPTAVSGNGDLGSIPPAMREALTAAGVSEAEAKAVLGGPLTQWLRVNPGKSWRVALDEIKAVTGKAERQVVS